MESLPFHHARRRITEPDEFGDAVSGISLQVEFQRRKNRPSTVEQFQSAEWALDFGETGVATRVSGVLRGGWASFCFSLGPGVATWNGHEAPAGCVGLLPPGAEVSGHTADGFAWVTAAIPPTAWKRCLALAGIDDGPRELTVLRLDDPEARKLRRMLLGCRSGLGGTADSVGRGPRREIGSCLVESFSRLAGPLDEETRPERSVRNRNRLARRAEDWLRGHLGEPCRVPDLCLALGVSRRELEYALRMVFDQSPRERLENLRLHAVRSALREADGDGDTVIDIAYRHGVSHLSRFAARYRELFGENPVETLNRRKAAIAVDWVAEEGR